ncbi:hypothetical protein FA13DRAFT_1750869, partial [Coprinellus micaceus]
ARRETISTTSPFETHPPSLHHERTVQYSPERPVFPAMIDEEEDLSYQNDGRSREDLRGLDMDMHDIVGEEDGETLVPRRARSDPSCRPSSSRYGLPTYQSNASRSNFDFSRMEDFAAVEKANLGLASPVTTRVAIPGQGDRFTSSRRRAASPTGMDIGAEDLVEQHPPREGLAPLLEPSSSSSTSQIRISISDDRMLPQTSAEENGGEHVTRPLRHRKISQSNSARPRPPRKGIGGKISLFESAPTEPVPRLLPLLSSNLATTSGLNPYSDFVINATGGGATPHGGLHTATPGQGHDRPYRFSFYSNSLSHTIHARSLSELPAEGQSFEDLFAGHQPAVPPPPFQATFGVHSSPAPPPGYLGHRTTPSDGASVYANSTRRVSSAIGRSSISTSHEEDILMEETREKIELFRNYYLVCFRSFDQDPYSPTHLEPLNMYIIVFREGTLSNVRRRIKQLKDYISVTSDWISYALIDDITDAFGPLIQSIEYEVDSIDELVLILKEAEQSDMLRRIGPAAKRLAKRCNENWRVAPTSDIGLYLSDIQDHLITMTQNLNHYEKILSRSHSNYLAQISIEMTDANNQINDVLSKLTALGTVLIPMNLDDEETYIWFASIIACLAAFALVGGYSTYKFMVRR